MPLDLCVLRRKVAAFLVQHFWGKPAEMADALGVLLLTWNQAFYRYGSFEFDDLERCIAKNLSELEQFRRRDIGEWSNPDETRIKVLFTEFLEALRAASSAGQIRRTPVAVAKVLHLLAPGFLPLWDVSIAREYWFNIYIQPAEKYVAFCRLMRVFVDSVRAYVDEPNRTILKLIDEYNYAKFVKRWTWFTSRSAGCDSP